MLQASSLLPEPMEATSRKCGVVSENALLRVSMARNVDPSRFDVNQNKFTSIPHLRIGLGLNSTAESKN